MSRRVLASLLLSATALAGCGTTVPVADRGAAGLGSPQAAAPGQSAGPGVGAPGAVRVPQGGGTRAGSTSGRGTSPGGAVAPATAPAAPGHAPVAARITTPLTLGILGTDSPSAAASALGVNNGNSFSIVQAQKALVTALNAQGGLAGRRIVPVYASINPQSNNYDSDFQAACATFTQDHKVDLVVSSTSILAPTFEQCVHARGIAHLEASYGATDAGSLKRYPGLALIDTPTTERREVARLTVLAARGWLTKANRLGVILEGCPAQVVGYDHGLVPTAKELGLVIADTEQLSCTSGFAAAGAQASALQNAQLHFRSNNVDRVVIVSNFEATFASLFAQQAESQGYRPGYALSSAAAPTLLTANAPAAQLVNMRAAGWLPTLDTNASRRPAPTASYRRCLALAKSQGINPTSDTDAAYLGFVCDSFFVLEALLRTSGGSATRADLVAAQPALGAGYTSAATLDGRMRLSALHDSVDLARMSGYQAGCSCFSYQGPSLRF